jgi:FkbM family methyltransferase
MNKVLKRLLSWESPFNPKVALTRAVVAILPDNVLHAFKKRYYGWLISHSDEVAESDAFLLRHLVSPGDHVVDVGAFVGFYTVCLSRLVGSEGRVYSIEPFPTTFEILAANVQKLGLRNVALINCAASDSQGYAEMEVPKWKWGVESFYDAKIIKGIGEPGLRHSTVATRTLDSLVGGSGRKISLIKCDAEFHELECLKGALRTIRDSRPALLVEVILNPDDPGSPACETFALLRREGYQPHWFDGARLHLRRPGEKSQNYFFLSPTHIDALRKLDLI